MPTAKGDINTKFEFDMFGVGSDAGQTTIRLRHAYGEFGQILAGQTNSLFMDGDIFPNIDRLLGPDRHGVPAQSADPLDADQGRPTPSRSPSRIPSNDIDSGQFREVADFPGAQGDQEYPDLTGPVPHERATGATCRSPASCAGSAPRCIG